MCVIMYMYACCMYLKGRVTEGELSFHLLGHSQIAAEVMAEPGQSQV